MINGVACLERKLSGTQYVWRASIDGPIRSSAEDMMLCWDRILEAYVWTTGKTCDRIRVDNTVDKNALELFPKPTNFPTDVWWDLQRIAAAIQDSPDEIYGRFLIEIDLCELKKREEQYKLSTSAVSTRIGPVV